MRPAGSRVDSVSGLLQCWFRRACRSCLTPWLRTDRRVWIAQTREVGGARLGGQFTQQAVVQRLLLERCHRCFLSGDLVDAAEGDGAGGASLLAGGFESLD